MSEDDDMDVSYCDAGFHQCAEYQKEIATLRRERDGLRARNKELEEAERSRVRMTSFDWAPYRGEISAEEKARVRDSALYAKGDTVLVWVNEGDLHMAGIVASQEHEREAAKAKGPAAG